MITVPLWNVETEQGWLTIRAVHQDTARSTVEKAGHTVYFVQPAEEDEC